LAAPRRVSLLITARKYRAGERAASIGDGDHGRGSN
jgi:hypothetical protein